jgi:hypothetical protein
MSTQENPFKGKPRLPWRLDSPVNHILDNTGNLVFQAPLYDYNAKYAVEAANAYWQLRYHVMLLSDSLKFIMKGLAEGMRDRDCISDGLRRAMENVESAEKYVERSDRRMSGKEEEDEVRTD